MKTITLKIPDELAVRLEKRASRLGVSKSALVRESIERELSSNNILDTKDQEEVSAYDLMKDGCGCVDSGLPDLATNPKHLKGFGR